MKIEINDTTRWQNSMTLKIILLAVSGLFLLIPLALIQEMIEERQMNSEAIRSEISFQWSGAQTISGPVLNIPVIVYPVAANSDPYKTIYHIMPEKLIIDADVNTERRHKSIYESVVYSSIIELKGSFNVPEISMSEKYEVLWNESYFTIGISDNRGIKGNVTMQVSETPVEAMPGLKDTDLFKSGISFPASITIQSNNIPFTVSMNVSGSESLKFIPIGRETEVTMNSLWDSPGFTGNFLPEERTVTKNGFNARWQITNLNRNFPQIWNGNMYNPESESFGTEFILQADHYQKSLRSAKYGILLIVVTFLSLLFTEMTRKEKIHIFHYLLMALGLVLFFSLLNSLSEHIGFGLAYVISGISTIILTGAFLRALIRNSRTVMLTTGLLVFLYCFIYILLTLKDYAYLAGNIGLFILLAVTMWLSLKLKDIT